MSRQASEQWNAWAKGRDARAFEDLVRPELPHALGFARRLGCSDADAADALQDAPARLVGLREGVPVAMGVRAWLCREVHVRARSRLRSERRRRAREAAALVVESCAVPPPALDAREEVEHALVALDNAERVAVELRYLHDLDYREMALVLGTSEGACRKRVHRALARLRERFGRDAAALVAALPLPDVLDAPTLVQRAITNGAESSGWGGTWIMTTTMQNVAVIVAVAAVAGAAATLAVQGALALDGSDGLAEDAMLALTEEIAARDVEIANLRQQLADARAVSASAIPDGSQVARLPAEMPETASATTSPAAPQGLDAIDWERLGAMLLRARKAEEPDAEAMGEIGKFLGKLGSMKQELGGGSQFELLAHPEVQSRTIVGIAKALVPELPAADRQKLQGEVRDAIVALTRDRPRDVAPLLRIDYDVAATERIGGLLAQHVGAERAAAAEGLTFGTGGNLMHGRRYVVAATRADMVKEILSYWKRAVTLDGD